MGGLLFAQKNLITLRALFIPELIFNIKMTNHIMELIRLRFTRGGSYS